MRSGPLVWVSKIVAALIVLWGIAAGFAVPLTTWREHGRRRSSWVLMMLLFGPLAVLLFYGTDRQHLLWPERYESIDGVAEADR